MSKTQRQPILNASLPAQFRQIRIALAREPGHPDGDAEVAYIIVAPLDSRTIGSMRSCGERIAMPAGRAAAPGRAGQVRSSRPPARRRLGVPL